MLHAMPDATRAEELRSGREREGNTNKIAHDSLPTRGQRMIKRKRFYVGVESVCSDGDT